MKKNYRTLLLDFTYLVYPPVLRIMDKIDNVGSTVQNVFESTTFSIVFTFFFFLVFRNLFFSFFKKKSLKFKEFFQDLPLVFLTFSLLFTYFLSFFLGWCLYFYLSFFVLVLSILNYIIYYAYYDNKSRRKFYFFDIEKKEKISYGRIRVCLKNVRQTIHKKPKSLKTFLDMVVLESMGFYRSLATKYTSITHPLSYTAGVWLVLNGFTLDPNGFIAFYFIFNFFLILISLLAGVPQYQKYIKNTYGPKVLKRLGFNAFWSTWLNIVGKPSGKAAVATAVTGWALVGPLGDIVNSNFDAALRKRGYKHGGLDPDKHLYALLPTVYSQL